MAVTKTKKAVRKAIVTTKNAAKKTGKIIVKNPVSTFYVLLGVLGIYAGYKIYRKFNPKVDDTIKNVGNGQTYNATITKQQAINFAQQLLDAMNVNRNSLFAGGTDEDIIEAVFDNLKNGDDFTLVFRAFGNKDYNEYNSPVEGLEFLDAFTPRNLVYWLNSEISSFWDSSLHKKVKQRVESAGFSF